MFILFSQLARQLRGPRMHFGMILHLWDSMLEVTIKSKQCIMYQTPNRLLVPQRAVSHVLITIIPRSCHLNEAFANFRISYNCSRSYACWPRPVVPLTNVSDTPVLLGFAHNHRNKSIITCMLQSCHDRDSVPGGELFVMQ